MAFGGAGLCGFEGPTLTEFSRTQEHQMRHFNLAGDTTSELGIDNHNDDARSGSPKAKVLQAIEPPQISAVTRRAPSIPKVTLAAKI
jgi:hypothetical protein